MKLRDDKSWLDDVLLAAFDSPPQPELSPWPPQADFDGWLRQHPEAVAALRSPKKRRRYPALARGVPVRLGAWLLGNRYRVAATAVGLVVLIALGAWLAGSGTPPVKVGENPAPRELPGPDPQPIVERDERSCWLAGKGEQENEGPESSAGLVRTQSSHVARPPDRQASASKADSVRQAVWARIDTTPLLAGGRTDGGSAGRVPLSIWLAEASAAVRARMVRITEDSMVCEVVRVIYGRVPGKTLHSAGLPLAPLARQLFQRQHGREPTAAEIRTAVSEMVKFKAGREVILTLGACRKTDERVVAPLLHVFHDASRGRSLDQHEKEIVDILEAGVHMMPRCIPLRIKADAMKGKSSVHTMPQRIPEAMGFYIPSCERIVRGRLVRGDDRTAEWEVVNVLSEGPPKPIKRSTGPISVAESKRLTIGLDPWRLRAEAVAAYRAAQDSNQPATEEAVRKEFTRLIDAELPVGREAILLVRTLQGSPGGPVRHKLVAIVFAKAREGQSIERLEKAIRAMIAKDQHLDQDT